MQTRLSKRHGSLVLGRDPTVTVMRCAHVRNDGMRQRPVPGEGRALFCRSYRVHSRYH